MSSSEYRHYTRDEFLAGFYPDPAGKAAIAAGMKPLRAGQPTQNCCGPTVMFLLGGMIRSTSTHPAS